jgi:hypothetical protein
MNPREFQSLASQLVTGTSPAHLRTAISRAYYAAYNVAVEILDELGFPIQRSPSGHGEVQNRLSNSGDPEVMRVGSQLAGLHGKRIRADYRLDTGDVENQGTAQALVGQADRMIQILESCRTDPKREQLTEGIRNYEQRIAPKL